VAPAIRCRPHVAYPATPGWLWPPSSTARSRCPCTCTSSSPCTNQQARRPWRATFRHRLYDRFRTTVSGGAGRTGPRGAYRPMIGKEGATGVGGHPGRRVRRAAIVRPPRGSARSTRSPTGSRERRRPYVGVVTDVGVSTPLLFLNVRATVARVACVRASVATSRTVNESNAVARTGMESRTVSTPPLVTRTV